MLMLPLGLGGLLRSAWAAAQGLGTSFNVLFVLALVFTASLMANCVLHIFPRVPCHPVGQWARLGVATSATRATLCPAVSADLGGAGAGTPSTSMWLQR